MTNKTSDWEDIARRLLHDELVYHANQRIGRAREEVARDVANGNDITIEHLEHLARAFQEVLLFIRECIVPLIDNSDEMSTVFELEARPEVDGNAN